MTLLFVILFLVGAFNTDKCFVGKNGQQYCDVSVGLGLQIPTASRKAAQVAICAALTKALSDDKLKFMKNLKYIEFDGAQTGLKNYEMIMDLTLRVNLNMIAKE